MLAAAPAVASVMVSSDPGEDDTYAIGDAVAATVTFSEAVDVDTTDGTPRLEIDVGGTPQPLSFGAGSGTATLTFTGYTVAEGDEDSDGIAVAANKLSRNSGAITKAGDSSIAAFLAHAEAPADAAHLVDGVRPTLSAAATSTDGASIELTFSEPLLAATAPASAFTVTVDAAARGVDSVAAADTAVTLTLSAAVNVSHTVTVAYADPSGDDDANAVQDSAGNDAPTFAARQVTNNLPSTTVTLSVMPDTVAEDAGGTELTVTGTLNGAVRTGATEVTLTVEAGTATATDDYTTGAAPTLTIDAGDRSGTATLTLTPEDDPDDEPNETVTIGGTVTGGALTVNAAELTITDNDELPGAPTLTAEPGDQEVTLKWTAPTSAGTSTIDGYDYRVSDDTVAPFTWDPDWTAIPDSGAGGANASSYTVTMHGGSTLANGTSYTFAVRARSAAGEGKAAQDTAKPGEVCGRTAQVRDAIVREAPVSACEDVTASHLAAITALHLAYAAVGDRIEELKTGDFAGLTGMNNLNLLLNLLTTLPEGIFSGLTALTDLDLNTNLIEALPAGVFDDLTALQTLDLSWNRLTELPAGIFDKLTALKNLSLARNDFASLRADVFGNLAALEKLELTRNDLTELPATIFANTAKLRELYVNGNRMDALPAGLFSGLSDLAILWLQHNPGEVFSLQNSLAKAGASEFKATIREGAPFEIVLPLTILGGTIAGGARTITIPKGALESGTLEVTRIMDSLAAVIVNIDVGVLLPAPPRGANRDHRGYALARSGDLPLEVLPVVASTAVNLSVSPAAVAEDAGATTLTVTATLNATVRNDATDVTLSVGADGDTATAGTDYATGAAPALTIAAGDLSGTATLTVTPEDDSTAEVDETVTIGGTVTGEALTVNAAELTIIDDDRTPVTATVALTSDPDTTGPNDDTYAIGDVIEATATFTAMVTVTGTPQLELDIGGSPRLADCALATDATKLVCSYTVAAGDADTDGVAIAADKLTLNGGSITLGGDLVDPSHSAASPAADHLVDGLRPQLTVAATSADGTAVVLTYDQPLSATTAASSAFTVTVSTANTAPSTPSITAPALNGSTVTLTIGTAIKAGQRVTVDYADPSAANDANAVQDAAGNDAASVTGQAVANTVPEDATVSALSMSLSSNTLTEGGAPVTVTVSTTAGGTFATEQSIALAWGGEALAPTAGLIRDQSGRSAVIVAAGETSGTVTLTGVERVAYTVPTTQALTGTVGDTQVGSENLTYMDSGAAPTATIAATPAMLPEGGDVTVTVTLSRAIDTEVAVALSMTDADSVVSGTLPSDGIAIAANETTGTVTLSTSADMMTGADAGVTFTLTDDPNAPYTLGTPATATVTVLDDTSASSAITLSVTPATVDEDAGATTLNVTATVNRAASTTATTVALSVAAGTATETTDYTATTATLTIAANQRTGTATLTLTPVDDTDTEPDETVTVQGIATGLTVTGAEVAILDDDEPPITLSFVPDTPHTRLAEEDGAFSVVVRATTEGATAPTRDIVVRVHAVHTASSTASAENGDFKPFDHTYTFAAGDFVLESGRYALSRSQDLELIDDATVEKDLQFHLQVDVPTETRHVTTPKNMLVVIHDRDTALVGFSADNYQVDEGEALRVKVVTSAPVDFPFALVASTAVFAQANTGNIPANQHEAYHARLAQAEAGAVPHADFVELTDVIETLAYQESEFVIQTVEDAVDEDDEGLVLLLVRNGPEERLPIAPAYAFVTIIDDDSPSTTVTLSVTPDTVGEEDGATELTVTGTLDVSARTVATEVALAVSDDTAVAADYGATTATLTIAATRTSGMATLTLTPVNDHVDEPDETVSVGGTVTGGVLTVTPTTVTITDDDSPSTMVTLSVTPDTVAEEDGATELTVTGTLDVSARTVATEVTLAVSDGTAVAADYGATAATLTIAAAQTSGTATLTLTPVNDRVDEPDETVSVGGAATGGALTVSPATVTISDDDSPSTMVTLSVTPDTVAENAGATELTVTGTLDAAVRTVATAVTLSAGADGDTATATTDYTAGTATLTIAAGDTGGMATLTLTPVDDAVDEGEETLTVGGTVSDGALTVTGATVTIAEVPLVEIAALSAQVTEGEAAAFTLTRLGAATAALTVAVQVTAEGEVLASPSDFASPVSVAFVATEATATLAVATDDDTTKEDIDPGPARVAGRVTAAVQTGTGYAPGRNGTDRAVVDVLDNEPRPPLQLFHHLGEVNTFSYDVTNTGTRFDMFLWFPTVKHPVFLNANFLDVIQVSHGTASNPYCILAGSGVCGTDSTKHDVYYFTVTADASQYAATEGELTVSIPADIIEGGNESATRTFTVDLVPLTVSLTGPTRQPVNGNFDVTIQFSRDVEISSGNQEVYPAWEFWRGDIKVDRGRSLHNPTGSGKTFAINLTPPSSFEGDMRVWMPANAVRVVENGAGNQQAEITVQVDTISPMLTITGPDDTEGPRGTFEVSFAFSEPVTGFAEDDISVDQGTLVAGSLTAGSEADTWTASITPVAQPTDDMVTITVRAGAVQDAGGNGNPQVEKKQLVDTSPLVTVAAVADPVIEGAVAAFTLTSSAATTAALTVKVAVIQEGEVLASPSNYASAVNVTFAANATSSTLSVSTDDDAVYEELSAAPGVAGRVTATVQEVGADYDPAPDADSATVEVRDDDPSPVTVTMDLEPASPAAEDAGKVTVTVTAATQHARAPASALGYRIETTAGTATAGDDFGTLSESRTLNVADFELAVGGTRYEAAATHAIKIENDSVEEVDETFAIALAAAADPAPAHVTFPAAVTVTITDDDEPRWALTALPATIAEDGGTAEVQVATGGVTFLAPQEIGLTFAGSATKDDDYGVAAETLTVAVGATAAATTITAMNDIVADADETIEISASLDGARIGTTATVTITDDDKVPGAPVLTAASGDRQVTLTWTKPAPGSADIIRYDYRVRDDGGTPWSDWTDTGVDVTLGTFSFTVENLDNGTTYSFEVQAVNEVGAGPSSNTVTATPSAGPVITGATTSTDGTEIILTYHQTLSTATAAASAFTVSVSTANTAPATRSVDGLALDGQTITLTVGTAIKAGQTVTVDYADPTAGNDANAVQDADGNDAASVTGVAVTNNVVEDATVSALSMMLSSATLTEGGDDVTVTITIAAGATFATDRSVALAWGGEALAPNSGLIRERSGRSEVSIAAGESTGTALLVGVQRAAYTAARTEALTATFDGTEIGSRNLTYMDSGSAPEATIAAAPAMLPEGGDITVTVTLARAIDTDVSVPLTMTDAESVVSGTLPAAGIPIAANETTGTVTLSTAADMMTGNDAAVTLTLTGNASAPYTLGTPKTVTVTVLDDTSASTAIALSVAPAEVGEADGATTLTVTATVNRAALTTATGVTLAVGDSADTATATTDYTAGTAPTLTIAANARTGTATLTLTPVDDTSTEDDETVTVKGTASGLTVSGAQVTILDDDEPAITLSFIETYGTPNNDFIAIDENDGTVAVTLQATTGGATAPTRDVQVRVRAAEISAFAEEGDFEPFDAVYTFAVGDFALANGRYSHTVSKDLAIIDDVTVEKLESFEIQDRSRRPRPPRHSRGRRAGQYR